MSKQYQWRQASTIISGGYAGEETGVIGGTTSWTTTDVLAGTSTAQYYYRDSDTAQNANSSRVVVDIREDWVVLFSPLNDLTVSVIVAINSIVRDDIRGNPGNVGRNIYIRRSPDDPDPIVIQNDPINTAHTISTGAILGAYSFTLAPGEDAERGSVYFRNNVVGHDSDPTPSQYVDSMWLGTAFKNILPKDYRPGMTWNGSAWLSHNRNSGAANIRGSDWIEMRTYGGAIESDNPPYMRHSGSWKNQQLIGQE